MIVRTKAALLALVEARLRKVHGFKGELWTDGEHFMVEGKEPKMLFSFSRFDERKDGFEVIYGMDPMHEMVIVLSMEIALSLDIVEPFVCDGCGSSLFYRNKGATSPCPACLASAKSDLDEVRPGNFEGEY